MSFDSPSPPLAPAHLYWRALLARVATAELAAVLGGDSSVPGTYLSWDRGAAEPRGTPTGEVWGRVVLVPVTNPAGEIERPGRSRLLRWLARAEFRDPEIPGWDPAVSLDRAHDVLFARLHGWRAGDLGEALAALACYRTTSPGAGPSWDPDRGVWWSSCEYRALIEPTAASAGGS